MLCPQQGAASTTVTIAKGWWSRDHHPLSSVAHTSHELPDLGTLRLVKDLSAANPRVGVATLGREIRQALEQCQ
jgi:hypothetical protein